MLTGRALDITASCREVILHRLAHVGDIHFFAVAADVAIGCLFGDGADGSGTEGMIFSEYFLDERMGAPLVFVGEVQVNIRRLVGIEAKEGLERNVLTGSLHDRVAVRTFLVRQVKSRFDIR